MKYKSLGGNLIEEDHLLVDRAEGRRLKEEGDLLVDGQEERRLKEEGHLQVISQEDSHLLGSHRLTDSQERCFSKT